MKYLSYDGLTHLKTLLKNALRGKSDTGHKHTKSEITDLTEYELPTASTSTLGGVKVGANLTIEEDGTLNVKNVETVTSWDELKDKPFGENEETILISEQTVALEGMVEGVAIITPDYYEEFIEGETYTINYRGKTYDVVIGEEYAMSNGSQQYTFVANNTQIPFLDSAWGSIVYIYALSETQQYRISDNGGADNALTISLVKKGSIKTIDEKFIPDTFASKNYVKNAIAEAELSGGR